MIGIYDANGTRLTLVKGGFTSFAWAEAYAQANYNITNLEMDPENVDCADFLTADGQVFAIQPTNPKQRFR